MTTTNKINDGNEDGQEPAMEPNEWAFDGYGHLYDLDGQTSIQTFGPPAPIRWMAIDDLAPVWGRRLALSMHDGPVYDHRAASEVYESNGGRYVNVVCESQWWTWVNLPDQQRPERIPRAIVWPTRHVWVECRNTPTGNQS